MTNPKSLIVIIGKTGAQVTTACIASPEEAEIAYQNARGSGKPFRIITGDEHSNVIYINTEDVFLCSIRRFVDQEKEKQEASKAGIITLDRKLQ